MKNRKRYFMTAGALIGAGAVLLGVGLLLGGKPGFYIDGTGLHPTYESGASKLCVMEKTKLEPFKNVKLSVDTGKVEVLPADDFYLEYSMGGSEPEFLVEDDTFTLKDGNAKSERTYLSFRFDGFGVGAVSDSLSDSGQYVKLYVPEDVLFQSFALEIENGSVDLGELRAEDASFSMGYDGELTMGAFAGKNLKIELDCGDLTMGNADADSISIESSYGNIKVGALTGKEISICTENGNLDAQLLKADALEVQSDFGDVEVKELNAEKAGAEMETGNLTVSKAVFGQADITTEQGDVVFDEVPSLDACTLDIRTSQGTLHLPNAYGIHEDEDGSRCRVSKEGEKWLAIASETGDITVKEGK